MKVRIEFELHEEDLQVDLAEIETQAFEWLSVPVGDSSICGETSTGTAFTIALTDDVVDVKPE